MFDYVRLKKVLVQYKQDFVSKQWGEEKYKWEAVKWFQDNWDVNAADFAEMLNRSLNRTYNLLASANNFPKGMIVGFAKAAPEEVRAMFMALFDESKDIFERMDTFKLQSTILLKKYGNGAAQHYQYENAISTQGFLASLFFTAFITVTSVIAILLFCSMFAWYITRVNTKITRALYLLCAFSMVVPFQMVMFTLSSMADTLNLNTPWVLWIIYLGFGAGLEVFMFCGFMRSVPIDIEEASMIDGCNPLQTYFKVVFPLLRPTMVSVAILEAMWIWNDYLLPTLVLDVQKYKTIPMLIQFFKGSYGRVEWGPMMACIVLAILPIVVLYLLGQKHIIKGVLSGAVKG